MGQKTRQKFVTLECSVCGEYNYRTSRNPRTTKRLELRKYCKRCRRHTPHKERRR